MLAPEPKSLDVDSTPMGTVVQFPTSRKGRPYIRLEPVDSRGVEALGYDGERRMLDIRYPGGAVYRYFDVSPQRHAALMATQSIGGYVNREIKPRYRYEQLQ